MNKRFISRTSIVFFITMILLIKSAIVAQSRENINNISGALKTNHAVNAFSNFFETYKMEVIIVGIIIVFLIIIIIILIVFSKKKIESEKEISSSYEEIILVHEELSATEEELRTQLEELRTKEEKIHNMAFYDSLTKLPNRVLFMDKLNEAIDKSLADNFRGALFLLDLDEFKKINDTFGHQNGDKLLVIVSDKLKKLMEDYGMVCRFGGDEFLVLIPEIKDSINIVEILDKIMDIFNKQIVFNEISNYITASIGIAFFPYDGRNADVILKNADTAMYKAKESGRNQYCFFNSKMSDIVLKENIIENNLRNAVQNNEFLVYYQPQIDIKTNKVVAMEALIRWNSRSLGFVYPSYFINVAEKTGVIFEIGQWIFEEVCRQIKIWYDKNYKFKYISINFSPIQIEQPNFEEKYSKIINDVTFPKELIEMEITETVLLGSIDENLSKLNKLKNLGIKIALDDFGTGFSSLNYLRMLPIDTVKIDKSFIDGICDNREHSVITAEIIKLAHNLNYNVIAEGVEKKEQLDSLAEMNCDYIQGYYFSKPLPCEEMEEMLKKNSEIIGK